MSRRAHAVEEIGWTLEANGLRLATGTASPGDADALSAGRLIAEGFLRDPVDLIALTSESSESGTVIRASIEAVRFEAGRAERQHRLQRGCGLLHTVLCDAGPTRLPRTLPVADRSILADQLRHLFETCDARFPGGGVHGAALADAMAIRDAVADVSRHSAVEKVLGAAFLNGLDRGAFGLVLTSRISGQIALAAARGGVAWVASRSIPTTLAVSIAAAAQLPLIARAASSDARLFVNGAGRAFP